MVCWGVVVRVERHIADRLVRMRQFGRADLERWHVGRLLTAAKKLVPHGEWMRWCSARGISKDNASEYMRRYRQEPLHSPDPAMEPVRRTNDD